eukprot:c16113_g1_i1.p1 GENE.c16113_g1_i1~~c16113_g1_i1.p1  ORF type:complete len:202 (+),score=54.65 c16113_g1_i1:63-668(+)
MLISRRVIPVFTRALTPIKGSAVFVAQRSLMSSGFKTSLPLLNEVEGQNSEKLTSMRSLNSVQLIGNLGRDAEVTETNPGSFRINLSVATTDSWKDKNGAWQNHTDWHSVVVYHNGESAPKNLSSLKQGDKVYLSGTLRKSVVTGEDGSSKSYTNIKCFAGDIFLVHRPSVKNSNAVSEHEGETVHDTRFEAENRRKGKKM